MTATRTARRTARRASAGALAALVLAAPLLAGCSDEEETPEDAASAAPTVDPAEAASIAVELQDADAPERLQAVVDALPELSEEMYDAVGVVADLPDGVLPPDVVADDVASFGADETGWFVLERVAGTVAENEAAVVARLTEAGYVEGDATDLEGLPTMRVFERAEDGSDVGVYVSDVSTEAADAADFPTRIGYLTTPELDG